MYKSKYCLLNLILAHPRFLYWNLILQTACQS